VQKHSQNVVLYSTGGTEDFIKNLDLCVKAVEDVTSHSSFMKVKTLHPFFGGILNHDRKVILINEGIDILATDLAIVDLYPLKKTGVASGADFRKLLKWLKYWRISLICAAAKNLRYCYNSAVDEQVYF
jgi:phosphoribosylaminoimidazolecarboxamide formyltransferase/IMP cyclohydrolase